METAASKNNKIHYHDIETGRGGAGGSGGVKPTRGIGHYNNNNSRYYDGHYQNYPPSIIRQQQQKQKQPPSPPHPESTQTSTEYGGLDDAGSSQWTNDDNTGSGSRISSKAGNMLRFPITFLFGRRSHRHQHNNNNNNSRGVVSEQDAMLSHNDHINYHHQEIKPTGTFDSLTEQSSGGGYYKDDPNKLQHPRSISRLNQKWGKLKDKIDNTSSSNNWKRSISNAQTMMKYGRGGGGGEETSITGTSYYSARDREELLKQAQDKFRNLTEFSLWHCFIAMIIYVGASIAAFSYWLEEDWSLVDSAYFAVVTFTTIGYGDLFPDTRKARMFTCFWALSGVAFLGVALGVLGSNLIEVAEKEQKKAKDKQKYDVIDMFDGPVPNRRPTGNTYTDESVSQWSELGYYDDDRAAAEEQEEEQKRCACVKSHKTQRFVLLFSFLVVLLYLISTTENWNPYATVYWGLITASTVGYGDLSPQTEHGRILAILYIPVAVGVMGTFLDVVANSIIAYRQKNADEYLRDKELTIQDLAAMDVDGDGTVTRAEFLEFMLVAMNQVDKETLEYLKEHFNRLDADKSGALDKNDLLTMAQSKIETERYQRKQF